MKRSERCSAGLLCGEKSLFVIDANGFPALPATALHLANGVRTGDPIFEANGIARGSECCFAAEQSPKRACCERKTCSEGEADIARLKEFQLVFVN